MSKSVYEQTKCEEMSKSGKSYPKKKRSLKIELPQDLIDELIEDAGIERILASNKKRERLS